MPKSIGLVRIRVRYLLIYCFIILFHTNSQKLWAPKIKIVVVQLYMCIYIYNIIIYIYMYNVIYIYILIYIYCISPVFSHIHNPSPKHGWFESHVHGFNHHFQTHPSLINLVTHPHFTLGLTNAGVEKPSFLNHVPDGDGNHGFSISTLVYPQVSPPKWWISTLWRLVISVCGLENPPFLIGN